MIFLRHEKEPVINYIANSHDRQTKTSWDKIDNEPAQIINRKVFTLVLQNNV